MKDRNNILFGLCEKYASNVMSFTSYIKCGFPSSFSSKYVLGKGFVIDNKQSYYQVSSVIPTDNYQLVVNKTCYDVDNVDNLNKCYGKVVCTSPQDSGLNVTCTIPLNSVVNPDGTLVGSGYITSSKDTYVKSVEYVGKVSVGKKYILVVAGNYYAEDMSKMRIITPTGIETLSMTYTSITNDNNETRITCESSSAMHWNVFELEGRVVCYNSYGVSDSIINAYIGGQTVNGSYSGGVFTVNYGSPYTDTSIIGHLVGSITLPMTPMANSPVNKYPDKILSVTLQRNMRYPQVELIASTIARYGSNFTSTCNGTCNIKYWKNRLTSTLPLPGDHIKMKYNDTDTMDYELVSYTVNCDTMSVDFNVGMQPLNVGDVIYRLNQNMTTNITTQ